ncbi:MAG TPA: beta-carotene 15,15'-monooxygenase [Ureibacillus sp.]|nr:beta-carotene 15,15'-monooxygenase [Ureibacillus sp.]
MTILQKSRQMSLLFLLLLVLGSNFVLYNTEFGLSVLEGADNGVVIGSLFDFVIIAPLLFLGYKKEKSVKQFILLMSAGLILARFLIPIDYLEPFVAITWLGFAAEAGILFLELLLLVTLFKFLPKIVRATRESRLPTLFSFSSAVNQYVKKHPLIQIICSEMLMFYYALMCWRSKPIQNKHTFTLHKNSSYISFQIMLIHAIVIETIGIHWWLHEKSMILSLVLLFLNVYSVIFFLADIHAVRLNPVTIDDKKCYLSLGLMKRMEIDWDEIEEVIIDKEVLKQKLTKDTIDFVARDVEEVTPNVILKLKKPKEATLIIGITKVYNKVAIKFDDFEAFRGAMEKYKS